MSSHVVNVQKMLVIVIYDCYKMLNSSKLHNLKINIKFTTLIYAVTILLSTNSDIYLRCVFCFFFLLFVKDINLCYCWFSIVNNFQLFAGKGIFTHTIDYL